MAGRESIFAAISLYFGRVDGVELIAGKKREGREEEKLEKLSVRRKLLRGNGTARALAGLIDRQLFVDTRL